MAPFWLSRLSRYLICENRRSQYQDSQLLLFSVSDTGVGLQTDKGDQILSAFFTTKTQGPDRPWPGRSIPRMIPLQDALRFGGFALVHAAWIASDLHDDELVCPIVMHERGDSREVLPCEASTQQEAIELGARKTEEFTSEDVDSMGVRTRGSG